MTEKKSHLGDELFEFLQRHAREEYESALAVTNRLARHEEVGDGELLDALHTYAVNLDCFNPLLPLLDELFMRYMDKCGMTETPGGIRREWCDDLGDDEARPADTQRTRG